MSAGTVENNAVKDSDFRSLASIPSWLTVKFGHGVRCEQRPIARAFLYLIEAALWSNSPSRLVVCFDAVDNCIRISFGGFSTLSPEMATALRDIADRIEAMVLETYGAGIEVQVVTDSAESTLKLCVGDDIRKPNAIDPTEGLLPLEIGHSVECADRDHSADANSMSICVFKRLVRPQSASHDGIGRDADAAKRLREIRARLWALGPTRQLRFPVAQWRQRLAQLEQDFPNFSAVIRTIVRPHLSLLSRHVAHRMTPILLVGSPGIGKTQFARELESILAVPALFISMCDESNNSALAGSSTFWSNSSPGKLFEQLAWGSTEFEGGGTANALVIVDEVDKVSASHYDPLGALYGLLEQETARRFEDQSVPGQVLDMSHMRFILTANDEMRIPEPLRSRVCTFHIEVPGEHEVQTIACRIYHSLLVRYQIEFEPSIPPAVLKEIAGLSPRHLKTRLEAALQSTEIKVFQLKCAMVS